MKLREVRWESAGKIAAGIVLAVAIAVSLPSLFASEKPPPLPPDVGLPQAAPPPPPAPAPDPAIADRAAAKRRAAKRLVVKRRRAHRRRWLAAHHHHREWRKRGTPVPTILPAPPFIPPAISPERQGAHEFGFE